MGKGDTPLPTMLDLYCCAGGASVGYSRAGFTVTGVDNVGRPTYPFEFVQADAIEYVVNHGCEYDVIHASPPCQAYSAPTRGTNGWKDTSHADLIEATRDALRGIDCPSVIENVPGAPIRKDIKLTGPTFGLGVLQPRYFELAGWKCVQPALKPALGRVRGWRHGVYYDGPYVAVYGKGGGKASIAEAQEAKGIFWTSDWIELCEAIPPAYTHWLGQRLIEVRAWES